MPDEPLETPWESCITMGDQWSQPNDRYKSTRSLIHLLVDVVAKGGNLLLNVGPQPDGLLPAPALERLREMGEWLRVNGEAIYGTRPLAPYKEGRVAFTRRGDAAYAITLAEDEEERPPQRVAFTGLRPAPGSAVYLLGVETPLAWRCDEMASPSTSRRPCAGAALPARLGAKADGVKESLWHSDGKPGPRLRPAPGAWRPDAGTLAFAAEKGIRCGWR